MRPRRRIDSLTAAVEDLAGSLRRRREGRTLRIHVYDAAGHVENVDADSPAGRALAEPADALLALADTIRARRP